jgi:hypothetical protein
MSSVAIVAPITIKSATARVPAGTLWSADSAARTLKLLFSRTAKKPSRKTGLDSTISVFKGRCAAKPIPFAEKNDRHTD